MRYLCAWIGAIGLLALPQRGECIPSVVPYDGYLEYDGSAVNGAVSVRFNIHRSDTGATIWTEEHSDQSGRSCTSVSDCRVTFYNGRFSVGLGRYNTALFNYLDAGYGLELSVAVRKADGTWLSLSGRQELVAAPYALWSAGVDDIYIGGDLTTEDHIMVGGTATVGGTIAISGTSVFDGLLRVQDDVDASGSLAVSGATTVGGDVYVTSNLTVTGSLALTESDTGAKTAMSHTTGDVLTINPSTTFSSGTHFNGPLVVSDDFTTTVNGLTTLEGTITMAGTSTNGSTSGAIPWFQARYLRIGDATSVDTGIAHATWFCFIGGHRFFNGDVDEASGSNRIFYAYTYESGSNWWVAADLRSHSDQHEDHEVLVVCVQESMVTSGSGWFQ